MKVPREQALLPFCSNFPPQAAALEARSVSSGVLRKSLKMFQITSGTAVLSSLSGSFHPHGLSLDLAKRVCGVFSGMTQSRPLSAGIGGGVRAAKGPLTKFGCLRSGLILVMLVQG